MEEFRQVGEALGSLRALLVFQENIEINRRQCLLLFDLFKAAYDSIGEEMRNSLRFDEKATPKWKVLEQPLRDLAGIFREGEGYVRRCLFDSAGDQSSFPAKVVTLLRSRDCVEFHVHNLLACVPVVVEAIEAAGEASGSDVEEMRNRRRALSGKYGKEFMDPRVFRWRFGREYLVGSEFRERLDSVWREDWLGFVETKKKKTSKRLIDLLCERFDPSKEIFHGNLFPSSILLASKDYHVRRRLGFGGHYKEILWLGESFALRHVYGDFEPYLPEISSILSLSHPNIVNALCGFADEERKEWFLVMELMSKDLNGHIKEICGPRKRIIPFSVPAAVDLMLQIARGMEYLHSKGIRHGDLNPSNVLVKARETGAGYLHAKVSGFGLTCAGSYPQKSSPSPSENKLSFIWHAPELLEGSELSPNWSEKSDIYSFGMVCFEVLTGKVPFEDGHLQGEKMSRNIRAGERPLFPYQVPKYLTSLTKKCWHADPTQRPTFSSLCRVLRYTKRFVSLSSDPEASVPTPDCFDIESGLLRTFPLWSTDRPSVSHIPFQMFAYRAAERERTGSNLKESSEESGSDAASICGDDGGSTAVVIVDDVFPSQSERKALGSFQSMKRPSSSSSSSSDAKSGITTKPGTSRSKSLRPPQINPMGRSMRRNSESHLTLISPRIRRTPSGHASDSELP